MAYAAWSVVFGEQPSAAKWNILGANDASFNDGTGIAASAITPEKLLTGTGTTWTMASWSPTLSGRFNDSKWDKSGTYIQIGKMVYCRLQLTANAATPMDGGTAEALISLPVTATTPGTQYVPVMGTAQIVDGGTIFAATPVWNTTGTITVRSWLSSGTIVQPQTISSTSPFTWASTDQVYVNLTYPAA